MLRPEIAASVGPDRFLRQIRLAARLQHPGMLPLFDSGTARHRTSGGPLLWYTMPLIEGESLRGRLRRGGRLPIADAVWIACEVADALEYAVTATPRRGDSPARSKRAAVRWLDCAAREGFACYPRIRLLPLDRPRPAT